MFVDSSRGAWYAAAALAVAMGALIGLVAGPGGLLYAALYIVGTLPGWPLGFALFGARHAAGWVAGALFGYTLLALIVWGATTAGMRSGPSIAVLWLAASALAFGLAAKRRPPLVELPAWQRRDTTALLLVLLVVPALFLFPYKNLGARDAVGNRYYRAYFTADFLWHMALTAEIAKYSTPPVNPYLSPEPLHYYWTYFTVPAAVTRFGPGAAADVEVALEANAICTAALFVAAIFLATWTAVPRAGPATTAVALTILAASGEGLLALIRDIWIGGQPWTALRELNVDALSNWYFRGLRIDGLPRSMWYTPQHSLSVALGVMALPIAGVAASPARLGAVLLGGMALGASTLFNPLLGGMFSLIYGAAILLAAIRHRAPWLIAAHALAAVPVAAAMAWCFANQMVDGAGSTLHFGVAAFARFRPVLTFCLSLGPLLLAAALGLWPLRGLEQRLWPALVGLVAGVGLLYFVVLIAETSYVGFRAGQIIQISLAPLAAAFFARLAAQGRLRLAGAVAGVLLLAGVPTTVIDTHNAQDIANLGMGPGFRWTIVTTPDEQAAFAWIKTSTRRTAIVQMDPIARARETWTQIPTFAERRMSAGLPISLINAPVYRARSDLVHRVYATPDVEEAWALARGLGIEYLYMDRIERGALPAGFEDKFASTPHRFRRVFGNDEVRIYAVVGG